MEDDLSFLWFKGRDRVCESESLFQEGLFYRWVKVLDVEHHECVLIFVFDTFEPIDDVGRAFPLVQVEGFSDMIVHPFEDHFAHSADFIFGGVDQSGARVGREIVFMVFQSNKAIVLTVHVESVCNGVIFYDFLALSVYVIDLVIWLSVGLELTG